MPRRLSNEIKKQHRKEYMEEYRQRPEVKQHIREHVKEYMQRPEVKQRKKEYMQRPEVKQRIKEYLQRPEVKQRKKEYMQRPEVKQYLKEYYKRPKVKQHRSEQYRRPEVSVPRVLKQKIEVLEARIKTYSEKGLDIPLTVQSKYDCYCRLYESFAITKTFELPTCQVPRIEYRRGKRHA